MARTKEERYILKLYEMALEETDPTSPFDRYAIGAALGLAYRGVDTICNTLLQANFIKKEDANAIYLTARGVELAQRLLTEG